jgi:hypothetical protein
VYCLWQVIKTPTNISNNPVGKDLQFKLLGRLLGHLKAVSQLRWLCTITLDCKNIVNNYYVGILDGDSRNLFLDAFLSFTWENEETHEQLRLIDTVKRG